MNNYEFTTDWFTPHILLWDAIIRKYKPRRVLEIGSFEGRSTTHLVEEVRKYHHDPIELVCVDSWEGGVEHSGMDFKSVEERFDHNMTIMCDATHDVTVLKRKGLSYVVLAELLLENNPPFDWVYIDGSHMATDVLLDATMAFKMLKVGGIIIFDDYAYGTPELEEKPFEHPQIAIDSFIHVNADKLALIPFKMKSDEGDEVDIRKFLAEKNQPLYQMYLEKKAD
jgi:predicted O-methyltransferase YrrM